YIKKTYNLLIGERTAEQIKIEIGSAFPLDERMTMEIKGRHLIEGVPKTITVSDEEIREALAETVNVIVDAVRVALERTPPELSAAIVDRGIVLGGGGPASRTSTSACARRQAFRWRWPRTRCRRWCSAPARCSRTSICCGRSRSTSGPPRHPPACRASVSGRDARARAPDFRAGPV